MQLTTVGRTSLSYYLGDLAPAPADRGVLPPPTWVGDAAPELGLRGPIRSGQFEQILSGRGPGPVGSGRSGPRAVCGFDATFSAPKSVSVLYALCDRSTTTEVLAAHAAAVSSAVEYLGDRGLSVRRAADEERLVLPARGLVGAAFTHHDSRVGDPHLHTHVVVANFAHGADGRWTALDGRGLFAHGVAAGAVYDAHLRYELGTRLGVTWRTAAGGHFEVEGVEPVALGAFSGRRAEILGHLSERMGGDPGSASWRASRVAWAATREHKDRSLGPSELTARWRVRAAALGLAAPQIAPLRSAQFQTGEPNGPLGGSVDERRFAVAVLAQSSPTRRHAVAAWANALVAGAPGGTVAACSEQLWPADGTVGVAERRLALREVLPASHAIRALGPRPASPSSLRVWSAAARAIDDYRRRWKVTDREHPLGAGDSALGSLPTRRFAEHLAVSRSVSDARRRLGRGPLARHAPQWSLER